MTQELTYSQLKTANEARESDEQRSEQRKRNILLLIQQYLTDEGYLSSADSVQREAGINLKKFSVCDNIDLATVLLEYESYYYIKFKRWPKISKRNKDNISNPSTSSNRMKIQSAPCKSQRTKAVSLPSIHSPSATDHTQKKANNDRRERRNEASEIQQDNDAHADQQNDRDLGLMGMAVPPKQKQSKKHKMLPIVDVKSILSNALKGDVLGDLDPAEKLLKPVAGFSGYSNEWRDLAETISKDIYLESPNVRWDDIIGLEEAKRLVKEAVVYPIKYPQLFSGILSPWKGLLLYGPPGTGKTLLAKAVATECKTTFFNISASTIVSKWRGDSEKLVRVLFELARFHAPSTIFVDELDSLISQRGNSSSSSGEHEGSRRMKTELLVQMDGLAKTDDLVFLLAASNLPWELDHAMLRRLEKRIIVDLPTKGARCAMLKHYLPASLSTDGPLPLKTEIDYEALADKTEGYSGSDIRLVCKEAAMKPIRKIFDILEANGGDGDLPALHSIAVDPIVTEDVQDALARTRPSACKLLPRYKQWQMEYESV